MKTMAYFWVALYAVGLPPSYNWVSITLSFIGKVSLSLGGVFSKLFLMKDYTLIEVLSRNILHLTIRNIFRKTLEKMFLRKLY